jgi:hypothetical protein
MTAIEQIHSSAIVVLMGKKPLMMNIVEPIVPHNRLPAAHGNQSPMLRSPYLMSRTSNGRRRSPLSPLSQSLSIVDCGFPPLWKTWLSLGRSEFKRGFSCGRSADDAKCNGLCAYTLPRTLCSFKLVRERIR